ncbi:MAG: DUF1127 domain-containing protein [Sodalis sp. (in: enterobacteria)]|uniref:DUF1127 domain-containing protein n=1 Tax=Sodalis sp. (in: enterobacteria) TaxID=1898979 RepID=UPI0039E2BBCF
MPYRRNTGGSRPRPSPGRPWLVRLCRPRLGAVTPRAALYRRDKRILLALSDDQLRDIGLTRGDIHHYNEALHQHWRARRR